MIPNTKALLDEANAIAKRYSGAQKGKLIPVWGTLCAPSSQCSQEVPSLHNIVTGLLRRDSVDDAMSDDVNFLLTIGDYVTAISWIALQCENFDEMLDELFPLDWQYNLADELDDVFNVFVSAGFNQVVSTDLESSLEMAFVEEEQIDYSLQRFAARIKRNAHSRANRTQVVRLHGSWGRRPLLTWQDYFRAYGLSGDAVNDIEIAIIKSAPKEAQAKYSKLVRQIFRQVDTAAPEHSELGEVVRHWLETSSFLMIGVSPLEPFYQVIRWYSEPIRTERIVNADHITLHVEDIGVAFEGVYPIQLASWEVLTPFFEELAVTFFETRGGENKEQRLRANNYQELREVYGDNSQNRRTKRSELRWIYQNPSSLIPFSLLWRNEHQLSPEEAIRVILADSNYFRMEHSLRKVRESYWHYRDEQRKRRNRREPQVNEVKIRINQVQRADSGEVVLEVEPVEYKDFLVTNHFVANVDQKELKGIKDDELKTLINNTYQPEWSADGFDPVAFLCGSAEDVKISRHAKCSNHLGVSSILVANYRTTDGVNLDVLLCPPSGNQISSPGEIIPTISGSLDWPLLPTATDPSAVLPLNDPALIATPNRFININEQMKREFVEECIFGNKGIGFVADRENLEREAYEYVDCLIHRNEVLNLCQNIQRGGKPEFFFLTSLKISANYFASRLFRPNWELKNNWWNHSRAEVFQHNSRPARRKTEFYPSPLNTNFELSDHWKESLKFLIPIIRNNGFNPVLRAHLYSIVDYCGMLFPETLASIEAMYHRS